MCQVAAILGVWSLRTSLWHSPQATKEAEHRDRLAELRARGDAARERANAEQELIVTSRLRREQADKCAPCTVLPLCASHSCIARPVAPRAFRGSSHIGVPSFGVQVLHQFATPHVRDTAAAAATVLLQQCQCGRSYLCPFSCVE